MLLPGKGSVNRARRRIGHCHRLLACVPDLSDILCLQGCNQWAVHLYMVCRCAVVVPPGIFLGGGTCPLIFWGVGSKNFHLRLYGVPCCSWCSTILRLLFHLCTPASVTDSLFPDPIPSPLVFHHADRSWPVLSCCHTWIPDHLLLLSGKGSVNHARWRIGHCLLFHLSMFCPFMLRATCNWDTKF